MPAAFNAASEGADADSHLGPQAVLILQLMQMVQDNADLRAPTKVLKRDAHPYKLFLCINSESFDIEVEIESLHHAETMLGYMPLYRWLSLLLETTSAAGPYPGLPQAVIVQGRFVELLGLRLLSSSDADNLFMVDLFPLLDQLLGVSTHLVPRQTSLPTVFAQELLYRENGSRDYFCRWYRRASSKRVEWPTLLTLCLWLP